MKKSKIPKGIFYAVGSIVGFWGISLINMPELYFIIILIAGTIYITKQIIKLVNMNKKYNKKRDKYKKKVNQYKNNKIKEIQQIKSMDKKCDELAHVLNYLSKCEKHENEFIKRYNIRYKKNKQKIMISSGAILCICFFNFNYVTSFAQKAIVVIELVQTFDSEKISEALSTSTLTPIPTQMPIPMMTPTLLPTSEPSLIAPTPIIEKTSIIDNDNERDWVEFKLEYPEVHPKISDSEFNELYNQIFYIGTDDLDETIESEIIIWMNSCTISMSLDNMVNSLGKSPSYYSEIEEGFSNEGGKLLSSDLLDEIISGREDLMNLYPNGSLAWLLANHHQTYALNYLYQTNSKKSILYFYMKSIYNAQKSLEYEMDGKSKMERIEYIQFRYKDIAECKILDDTIRIRAYEILTAMQSKTNELKYNT